MVAASSSSLDIPTKKDRIIMIDTGRRNAIYGRSIAHSVFFNFNVFNSMNSGSRHTCGDSKRPPRQNRKSMLPHRPASWQMPNAAKEAIKVTPIMVPTVTMILLVKYCEIPLLQAVR